ncbi:DUF4974 domain-containing protein [Maribellus sp. CM-23]|uniref:FecR family protein n=1 Tax=Maribellus sp. CM-23 TaxID=2781026 RepID=UPI001F3FB53A|nr:FecR domain-containing protein [Maribellus sp. CM-23]MCE4565858.1 DUF4974 domain-containing protein [Maribellus sp. CM-23]
MDYGQDTGDLILKSLTGNLGKEEKVFFEKWLAESVDNKQEYQSYKKLWSKSGELIFSDSIDVESSLKATKDRMDFNRGKKRRWLYWTQQIAAILVLAIVFASLYQYFTKPGPVAPIYQNVSTTYGMQTSITLADGTKVWLNSDSHLHFPVSFDNMDERRVVLNGEAFFEVTHNPEIPFIVNAGELDVKVLGTSFNVSAYNEYDKLTVALQEGKVSLVQANSDSGKELLTMKPNQVATFNYGSRSLNVAEESDLGKYCDWKEGRLAFFGDDIETVVQKLEKWYNVETVIADEAIQQYHFTATFTDETLNQALSLLCSSSGINYKVNAAERKADGSYTKRKVILSSKKIQ